VFCKQVHMLHIYAYIYICVCVCGCVGVCNIHIQAMYRCAARSIRLTYELSRSLSAGSIILNS
jgi:hypothetical protein